MDARLRGQGKLGLSCERVRARRDSVGPAHKRDAKYKPLTGASERIAATLLAKL
jgi:hypothetical protein